MSRSSETWRAVAISSIFLDRNSCDIGESQSTQPSKNEGRNVVTHGVVGAAAVHAVARLLVAAEESAVERTGERECILPVVPEVAQRLAISAAAVCPPAEQKRSDQRRAHHHRRSKCLVYLPLSICRAAA
jgi:hypothetical protein